MTPMSTATFDTLEATRRLRDAGFNEKQAETAVRVIADAQDSLATKNDLTALRSHIDAKLETLDLRLTLKIGALLAAVGGIVIAAVLRLPV